jgi:hypothetical protein
VCFASFCLSWRAIFSIRTVSPMEILFDFPLRIKFHIHAVTLSLYWQNNAVWKHNDKFMQLIIVMFINYNWVVTRWQWSFNTYTKHEIGLLLNFNQAHARSQNLSKWSKFSYTQLRSYSIQEPYFAQYGKYMNFDKFVACYLRVAS